ncbi:hypothetical protein [Salinarimonas chemoclinalis]|uniref:hypothetical protein n=1 Tax=Salinarimonas chemoclinalis TaxID=3241599 RepID=UPI003555F4BB
MRHAVRACMTAIALGAALVPAVADSRPGNWRELTVQYCTAFQAGMLCNRLKWRGDTETAFMAKHGFAPRGYPPQHEVTRVCISAMVGVEPENCEDAWRRFGCSGTEHARLIQENAATVADPILCRYD